MRFNKLWLDELVSNNMTADEVSDIITMAGLEVDSVDPVCGSFQNERGNARVVGLPYVRGRDTQHGARNMCRRCADLKEI